MPLEQYLLQHMIYHSVSLANTLVSVTSTLVSLNSTRLLAVSLYILGLGICIKKLQFLAAGLDGQVEMTLAWQSISPGSTPLMVKFFYLKRQIENAISYFMSEK